MAHQFSAPLGLRIVVASGLFVILLLLGTHDYVVFEWLGRGWQHVAPYFPTALSQSADPSITKRLVPLVVAYALSYVSLSIALLAVLLGTWPRVRFVLWTYAASFLVCALLLLLGKITHNALGMYRLGRNLIDFTVSILPVAMLAPLLLWYYPNRPTPSAADQPPLPGGNSVS